MKKIAKFFRDLKAEFKKVIWPTRKQLVNNTTIVIICVLLIGACIWILDYLFTMGASKVIGA